MAIAKNPRSNQSAALNEAEREAKEMAFINKGVTKAQDNKPAQQLEVQTKPGNKLPIMIRIDSATLQRIDKAAKRRGISRSAFIVSAATKEVDTMQ